MSGKFWRRTIIPKNKKINPRRVPVTQADVEDARVEGCEIMANIVLFLLSNDFAFSHEDIHRVHERIELYLSQIIKRQIKYENVKAALHEEYNVTVRFT